MVRASALAFVWGALSLVVACYSARGDEDENGGAGSAGTPAGGGGGGASSGGSSGDTSGGASGSGGSTTSCVTETRQLIDEGLCDFTVPADVGPYAINVYYGSTVGGGAKACWRASSQGCDPHGWWLNGGKILLCDETCSAYFDPEPEMVVYIEIGCPADTCF